MSALANAFAAQGRVVAFELQRVVAALRQHAFRHLRMTMQRVGGDDAAFQIEAFQGVEGRLDFVAVAARARGERKPRFGVPHADHQRRHVRACAFVAAPQPLAINGDDALRRAKAERLAQGLGESQEGFGCLVGIKQTEKPPLTVCIDGVSTIASSYSRFAGPPGSGALLRTSEISQRSAQLWRGKVNESFEFSANQAVLRIDQMHRNGRRREVI